MKTKLLYLFIPLIFSGCLACMSHDKSQEFTGRACLNEKFLKAARSGSLELMIGLLNQGVNVNTRNKNNGYTALHWAANSGHFACVKALIEAKADVNVRTYSECTALHLALRKGHLACVKVLLEAKADVNVPNDDGETALHRASESGYPDCVKALIEAKANVNARNNHSRTALYLAAREGQLACVKALIEAKADVNARNNDGWTVLHRAATEGHLACVKALIEAEADINARDNEGKTAFYYAAQRGHLDCVKTLVKCSYMLSPSKEVVSESRKRIFGVLLLFARLGKPHEEGGQQLKDLGNTSLQFEILSKSKLLQNDLIVIFLDELKKEREIKPGLLSRSKEAVVMLLLNKVTEMVSTINVSSMKADLRDLFSDAKLEELIKEGLDERINNLKSKVSV